MNKLYFGVKGSTWKAEEPTAYYIDDICEFIANNKGFDKKDDFVQYFFKPLMLICRKKYDSIINERTGVVKECFVMEIPYKFSREAKHALLWYMKNYPNGDFIETARDFSKAINRSEKEKMPIVIFG